MKANFYAGTIDAKNFTKLPLELLKAWQQLSKDAERLGCTLVVFRVPTADKERLIEKAEGFLQETYPEQIITPPTGTNTV
jgi:hypothetical protein